MRQSIPQTNQLSTLNHQLPLKLNATYNERQLEAAIARKARICGTTAKEETRTVFKGLVRDAIRYTPPASAGAKGKDAQRQGESAISRDLSRMGFAPKQLKGFRIITQAFGHPITPVRVPTKENPQFADPDSFHLARLQSKHGGRVARGGRQAFYVSKQKFISMRKRLFTEIGMLASGWLKAARQLGIVPPAWIARHASGRGTEVQIFETATKISMRVVNHFPDGAPAAEMIRRIKILKDYAVNRLKRQFPFLIRKKLKGGL